MPEFRFFNEEWNESTTDGDYLEDGIDDFVSTPSKSEVVED